MDTFDVHYRITVEPGTTLDEKVRGICLEQSVELPGSLVEEALEQRVVPRPVHSQQLSDDCWRVIISWPADNIGGEVTQFLNLLYGNISMKPGIRVEHIQWAKLPSGLFQGPAFGIRRLKEQYGWEKRPVSCTALKPMGMSAAELAERCYEFAAGGVDIIKDDHGIANQRYAPFEERTRECVKAVERAARDTGHRALYFPNITGEAVDVVTRYKQAAALGADGVLLCPHLSGLAVMHRIAQSSTKLPVMAHPAFSGSLTIQPDQGFSPGFLYGELWRALGADFAIYPNTGGRFSFTPGECSAINKAARSDESSFRKTFPVPGGGIHLENVGHWIETYGPDTVFLIGGSLYEHPKGIRYAARGFSEELKKSHS